MELEKAIKTRRSIRIFSDKKLEKEALEKIIDAGNHAPSHCNTQSWKFVFINNPNIRNKIFENGGSHVIKNAPYGILALYSTGLSDNLEYQDWLISASAAMQNMLLTIHDLGLGGCLICHLPRKKVLKKILNIQKPYTPIAYIAFGYSQKNPVEIPRKRKVSEIYAMNEFIWPQEKTSLNVYYKRLAKKIYYRSPLFIKKTVFPLADKLVKKFHN